MSAARQPVDNSPQPPSDRLLSPQEYLERERRAPERSEYVRGKIYAMAGAKPVHNLVVASMMGSLVTRLRGKPCVPYADGQKVQAGQRDAYFYSDVVIICGPLIPQDGTDDVATNPTLLVEVASPSTQRYDKEARFDDYARIPSLTDYLLISTDRPGVRHYARQDNGQWLVTLYSDLNAAVALPALEIELPLSEIYDRMQWETPV